MFGRGTSTVPGAGAPDEITLGVTKFDPERKNHEKFKFHAYKVLFHNRCCPLFGDLSVGICITAGGEALAANGWRG